MRTDRDRQDSLERYTRGRQHLERWGTILGGLTLVLIPAVASQLRWAHLYRQRTNEGLAFAYVFAGTVLASVLATASSVMLWLAADRIDRTGGSRAWLRTAGAVVVAFATLGLWAVALWVESFGKQCIGSC